MDTATKTEIGASETVSQGVVQKLQKLLVI